MRSILLGVCCAFFASQAGAQTVPPNEQLVQNQSLLWLNVKGGQFQSLLLDSFDAPVQMEMELTLESVNAHAQWAPGASVCVVGKASDVETCIRIAGYGNGSTDAYVFKALHSDKDGRKTLMTRDPVPGQFKIGSKIRIALRSGPDSVEFKVDDGAWLMQALPFTPQALRLICSSALCKLRLNDKDSTPPGA